MSAAPHADKHFDLIIIGSGSGNSIPGPHNHHKSIAIVEPGRFGGTCLNVGCIPTKMYVYAAEVAHMVKTAGRYGVHAQFQGVDWPSIRERVFDQRIDLIASGGEEYRRGPKTPNIEVFDAPARFVAQRTIATGQGDQAMVISGEQIVLAAGARPHIPEVIADSQVTYHTNETIMRLDTLPKSMTVLGGGYVALEFAHVFEAFGTKVTLINRSDRLMRTLDDDISARITELTSEKITTHLGRVVTAASEDEHGVTVTLDDATTVTSEVLLVATGRIPNGDQMDLALGGIEMQGQDVVVDKYGRTTAPGVWALGDISSPYKLKHVANAEMRAIRHNLDVTDPADLQELPHTFVPAGVFTIPPIGFVGLTEREARAQGLDITVKIQNYGDVAYGWAMEDTTGFAKIIADRSTGKILGAHYIGPEAPSLVQQIITAMNFDIGAQELATNQYWIHPALPEVTENALLGLEF
ncbi:mycothione reductase [Corynebacterium kozikiae]|uniref:mycothione reductase n=1 Tax=Corynebacterium kozikiae TaxID=2968469 RepID=UPI00211C1543|nr:mycothione reductase [Corynebacterium sp. 76QC2CO]MCQ9342393.1 mycothione reductase [Corynebacterium sp. 76QC2CO]